MIDPSLAPTSKHTLHAYLPATEPYELWDGLDRRSEQYQQLKEERSRVLWDGALLDQHCVAVAACVHQVDA